MGILAVTRAAETCDKCDNHAGPCIARRLSHSGCVMYVPGTVITFGSSGVDIFFVISGFIICQVAARPHKGALHFLARRCWRIFPLYWIVLALSAKNSLAAADAKLVEDAFEHRLSELAPSATAEAAEAAPSTQVDVVGGHETRAK
jgi:peptidoglycan/LPS O-acetylase OafA/YrhL